MRERSAVARRLAALEETARQRSAPVLLSIHFAQALSEAYGEPGDDKPEMIPLSLALACVESVYAETDAPKAQ